MIVLCNVHECGFYDRGFCRNKTLSIIGGQCSFLFNKRTGGVNSYAMASIAEEYKEKLIIMDGEIKDEEEDVGINSEIVRDNSQKCGEAKRDE